MALSVTEAAKGRRKNPSKTLLYTYTQGDPCCSSNHKYSLNAYCLPGSIASAVGKLSIKDGLCP